MYTLLLLGKVEASDVLDINDLFRALDKDGSGICEVREIVQELRIEPSAEESRWYRTGIGRQTLYPSRDVYIEGVQPSTCVDERALATLLLSSL